MGILQRIEESKAAAQQLSQEQDQSALIEALEAEMADEIEGVEEPQDPIVVLEVEDSLAEPEAAPAEPEATPATKSKGKKS